MSPEDRELLAELARLNSDLVSLAMGVMEERLSSDEQHAVACRLVDLAEAIEARVQSVPLFGGRERDEHLEGSASLRSSHRQGGRGRVGGVAGVVHEAARPATASRPGCRAGRLRPRRDRVHTPTAPFPPCSTPIPMSR